MTQKQKNNDIKFLYELLMHREGDIRRQAADLMGNIIVNYDEDYIEKNCLKDVKISFRRTYKSRTINTIFRINYRT